MASAVGGAGITLSVIVPAHRAEKTIRRAINSILLWPGDDMEVIVIDDGSDDYTAGIVREVTKVDARVRLLQQGNAGRSAARNAGFCAARGEWVMFLDADDYLLADGMGKIREMTASSVSLVLFPVILSARENVVGYSDISWKGWGTVAEDRTLPASALRSFMIDPACAPLSLGIPKRLEWYETNSAWARLYRRKAVLRLSSKLGEGQAPFPVNLRFSEDKLFNLALLDLLGEEQVILSGHPAYYWDLGNSDTCAVVRVDDAKGLLPFKDAVNVLVKNDLLSMSERSLVFTREAISQFRRSMRLGSSDLHASKRTWRSLLYDEGIRSCLGSVPCASMKESIRVKPICWLLRHEFVSVAFMYERSIFLVKKLFSESGWLRQLLSRSVG